MSSEIIIGNFVIIYFLLAVIIVYVLKFDLRITDKTEGNYKTTKTDLRNLYRAYRKIEYRINTHPKYQELKDYKILHVYLEKNEFIPLLLGIKQKKEASEYTYLYKLKDKNNLIFKVTEEELSKLIATPKKQKKYSIED